MIKLHEEVALDVNMIDYPKDHGWITQRGDFWYQHDRTA